MFVRLLLFPDPTCLLCLILCGLGYEEDLLQIIRKIVREGQEKKITQLVKIVHLESAVDKYVLKPEGNEQRPLHLMISCLLVHISMRSIMFSI